MRFGDKMADHCVHMHMGGVKKNVNDYSSVEDLIFAMDIDDDFCTLSKEAFMTLPQPSNTLPTPLLPSS